MQAQKRPNWLMSFELRMNDATYQDYRLMIGGLIAFSLIIVQAFIATGLTDPASYISVIAFAIAIPFLAMFVWMYSDMVSSTILVLPSSVGILLLGGLFVDLIGIDAAFWHISWIAGLLFLVSGLVSFMMFVFHSLDLEEDDKNPLSRLE